MDLELQPRSVLGRQLAREVARNFGEVCLKVTGASMLPAVWPGDVITVRRRELMAIHPGMIVLYTWEGKLVAHRVVRVDGDVVITRGDCLWNDDPPIEESHIVGQVIHVTRNGRCLHLRQSFGQRLVSSILRRSDFCTRMTLRLGRRLRRACGREISWAN